MKIGYQGVWGSFSSQALCAMYPRDAEPIAYRTFADVFAALTEGAIEIGILPIENSSTGTVNEVYDLLTRHPLYIVREYFLPISHCLLGTENADEAGITTVLSHGQAIEQSSSYLAAHPHWQAIHHLNTAAAAKLVADKKDPSVAAIASKMTAELYGLKILRENVQNSSCNTTRFVALSRSLPASEEADTVSLCLKLSHKSGSLYSALSFFFSYGLNLTKIQSRPLPDEPWNYLFFVDVSGNLQDENVKNALHSVHTAISELRILGCYASAI